MKTPSHKYPLRKILYRQRTHEGVIKEHLECGHEQSEKSDIYGPAPAERRRCRKCYQEQQKETTP